MGCGYALWLALAGIGTSCLALNAVGTCQCVLSPGVFSRRWQWELRQDRLLERSVTIPQTKGSARRCFGKRSVAVFAERDSCRRADWMRAHVPSHTEYAAAAELLSRLRAVQGDVLFPFHPFYPHLVGKRTYLHRMGVWDARDGGVGWCGIFTPRCGAVYGDCDGRQSRSDVDRLARHPAVLPRSGSLLWVRKCLKEPARTVPSLFWCPWKTSSFRDLSTAGPASKRIPSP